MSVLEIQLALRNFSWNFALTPKRWSFKKQTNLSNQKPIPLIQEVSNLTMELFSASGRPREVAADLPNPLGPHLTPPSRANARSTTIAAVLLGRNFLIHSP